MRYTLKHFEWSRHFMLFFHVHISNDCGFTKSFILQSKFIYALGLIRFLSCRWMHWLSCIPMIIGFHRVSIGFRHLDIFWKWVQYL